MIRRFLFSAVAVVAGTSMVAVGAPKDEVTDAAKKLAEAPNYSWKSTTEMAGGGGGGGGGGNRGGRPMDGKAEKDGFVHVTMTRGDNTIEVVRKGDKGAVKTPDGWQSFEELQSAGGGGGGQGGGGRMMGRMLQNMKAPAQQAADLAAKTKELKKSGDAYEADLTEEGVKELLSFGGRRGGNAGGDAPPAPTNTSGKAKFWLKDGQLAKYEYQVKGTMSFQGNEREIDRTTTVEIKDVGSTKVEVPAEAKSKVG